MANKRKQIAKTYKTAEAYMWEHIEPSLNDFCMKNYKLLCEYYWDMDSNHIIYKFLNNRYLYPFLKAKTKILIGIINIKY